MKPLYTISVVYSMALIFLYVISQLNLGFLRVISNIVFPITAGLAVISCMHAYVGYPVELLWLWGFIAFLVGLHIHRREF